LRKGAIRINGLKNQPDYRLRSGDVVTLPSVRVGEPSNTLSSSIRLQTLVSKAIIFENDQLLILNKPAGIAVHGGSGISAGVIEVLRQLRPLNSLELVHRLDRDTSGCLMVAKKRSMLRYLHALLRVGAVEKTYLALVGGQWRDIDKVEVPLRKNILRSGERIVVVSADGKPALTHFKVQTRFKTTTLVEAKPYTGRTHQIRVHAQHVHHPIVGDEKYGDKTLNQIFRTQKYKRLFLHAQRLKLIMPTGEVLDIHAELPHDFQACLQMLAQ
jgi:23S rRNA pseudouridine955/2504/2580 synthase